MQDELRIRVSFELRGKAARAFIEEQSRLLRLTGSSSDASKSAIGYVAMVEYLNRRDYNIPNERPEWGGDRTGQDENEGQLAAV